VFSGGKRRDMQNDRKKLLRRLRFYPPFIGAGIRVKNISEDFRRFDVEMPLKFWNRNYVGTHFGGSLYAMTDPWFMFILMHNLGSDFIVWDKAATIRFKRPGKGLMKASFEISAERLAEIRAQAEASGKIEPVFNVSVTDSEGTVIAEVEKLLYVRKKDARKP
jgi:Domain of unknown function (DUF4442)